MSENEQKNAQAAASAADDGEVFEVFQQAFKDPVPHHGGNLLAPDAELAVHYAKEFYGRRQESNKLWIVPRSAMVEVSDPKQLPPLVWVSEEPLQVFEKQQRADESCPYCSDQEPRQQAFAVFVQKQAGKHLTWLQDVEGMSLLAAAETAMHDGGYLRLWLCPRSAIIELSDANLLQPPLDRSYRRLDGYNIREKLQVARKRAQGGEKRHA